MNNQLQSPIVRFGIVVGCTFAMLGALPSGYFLTKIFVEAKASVSWPQTQGKLEKAEVVKNSVGRFHPEVPYRYEVDGRSYTGTRIRTSDGETDERKSMEKELVGLDPGASVSVFFDPEQPQRSVLRTGASFQEYALLFIPFIMLGMGIWGFYRLWKYKNSANKARLTTATSTT